MIGYFFVASKLVGRLAERYPGIDLERAGIYGHSGGGYAAAGAMFRFPDFFKVGISDFLRSSLNIVADRIPVARESLVSPGSFVAEKA